MKRTAHIATTESIEPSDPRKRKLPVTPSIPESSARTNSKTDPKRRRTSTVEMEDDDNEEAEDEIVAEEDDDDGEDQTYQLTRSKVMNTIRKFRRDMNRIDFDILNPVEKFDIIKELFTSKNTTQGLYELMRIGVDEPEHDNEELKKKMKQLKRTFDIEK